MDNSFPVEAEEVDALTEAVLLASRVFVAVAAESLAELHDVTLPQYRVLAVLAAKGPQKLASLATALDVNPSTATRLCDRLVRKHLVRRETATSDRREVRLATTPAGETLVRTVMARRRARIADIVQRLAPDERAGLVEALQAVARAAGAVPEQSWSLGWSSGGGAGDGGAPAN